jgi:hypothetical protein
MKTIRTYPNIFWIAFNLFIAFFVLWFSMNILFAVLQIQLPIFLKFNKTDSEGDGIVLLFILLLILVSAYQFYILSYRTCYILFHENGVTLIKPLKAEIKFFKWQELKGFSTSQICYKLRSGTVWSSDSVVIYTADRAFEIIKIYNFRFKIVEKKLNECNVKYLGFEAFRTGFIVRKYKFLNTKTTPQQE